MSKDVPGYGWGWVGNEWLPIVPDHSPDPGLPRYETQICPRCNGGGKIRVPVNGPYVRDKNYP